MERLTHKARYEAGYKPNKGVKEWQASDRLGAYENTGLTPEEIRELKDRDTAKNPVPSQFKSEMVCPVCGSTAYPWNTFCDECGQRLWDDEKP